MNRITVIALRCGYLDKWRKEELEQKLAERYVANASQVQETAEAFSYVGSELPKPTRGKCVKRAVVEVNLEPVVGSKANKTRVPASLSKTISATDSLRSLSWPR